MKSRSFVITGALVAAIAMCSPMAAFAATKKASSSPSASPAASASAAAKEAASPAAAKAPRALPFYGTVSSVDQSAKTFTIQGKLNSRVFKVGDQTQVTKAGAAATMADIAANEKISGSYWKQADGSLEAKSVKIGGAGDAKAASSKSSKKKSGDAASSGASPAASASPSASPKK